jgi:hypothetical protein
MELNTKVNGIVKAEKTVGAYKFGLMVHCTKGTGKMIKQMEEGDLFTLMGMFITESGRMTKLMALVFTITQMVQDMKVNGLRTNSMVKAKKSGLIMLATKAIIRKVRSMDTANSYGLMDQLILEPLSITILKEQASTLGLMDVNLMVSGVTIRCTEVECLLGLTADVMKESTLMIRSTVMVSLLGPMDVSMKVSGKMESNTVSVPTILAKVKLKRDNGLMESAFNGSRMNNNDSILLSKHSILFFINFFQFQFITTN